MVAAIAFVILASPSGADILLGGIDDFQGGTTMGWGGGSGASNISSGGPDGATDSFLQVGGENKFAVKNQDPRWSGSLAPGVQSISVELMRPATDPTPLEIRIVLMGVAASNFANDRWTSATPHVVPNNGNWNTYSFSVQESDLVQVQGMDTYANLVNALTVSMFRHDPAPASAGGVSAPGTLGVDNIRAVPEPNVAFLLILGAALIACRTRRNCE